MSSIQQGQVRQVESIEVGARSPNRDYIVNESPVKSVQQARSIPGSPPSRLSPGKQTGFRQSIATEKHSHYRSTLYYSQAGQRTVQQGATVFYNQNQPGSIHRKSHQQLQYENGVLLQQLQERDEVLAMYKSGWKSQNFPINDDLVRNLNLQLAQKNVLIEQFHRSLSHFNETIQRQNIQLSQVCVDQFYKLQQLIYHHEQYPILITQRMIDTSRSAQKIIIRDQSYMRQWEYKLERSREQVVMLVEKLTWYERQTHTHQTTIINLRNELEQLRRRTIQDTNRKNHHYQQEIHSFQQQITVLHQEINTYKQQLSISHNQINSLKQQINVYVNEINGYRRQIDDLGRNQNMQINEARQTIHMLQNQINSLTQEINILRQDAGSHKEQFSRYNTQIRQLKIYIEQLQRELQQQRRKQNEFSQEMQHYHHENQRLEQQIVVLRQQINSYKQEIVILNNTVVEWQNKCQIEKGKGNKIHELSEELSKAHMKIVFMEDEIKRLKQTSSQKPVKDNSAEMEDLRILVQKYRAEIIKYKNELESKDWELQSSVRENDRLKGEIARLKSQNFEYQSQVTTLNQEIWNLKTKIRTLENDDRNESFEWKTKYEESQTIIRKLRIQLEESLIYKDYKFKYDQLYSQFVNVQNQLQYYQNEYARLQEEFKRFEGQIKRNLTIQIRQELQVEIRQQIEIELRRHLEIEIRQTLESEIRRQLEIQIRTELQMEIRGYLEVEIRRQLEIQIRTELQMEIRRYLEVEIRRQLEVSIRRDLEITIRRELEEILAIQIRKQLEEEITLHLRQTLQVALRRQLEIRIREELQSQIRIQIQHKMREQLTPIIEENLRRVIQHHLRAQYERIKIQYETKVQESIEDLRRSQDAVRQLLYQIERLEVQIHEIQAHFTAIIQRFEEQDSSEFEQRIRQLQHENEHWKEHLAKAEEYIVSLLEEIRCIKEKQGGHELCVSIEDYNLLQAQLEKVRGNCQPNEEQAIIIKNLNDQINILNLKMQELSKVIEIETNEKNYYHKLLQEREGEIHQLSHELQELKINIVNFNETIMELRQILAGKDAEISEKWQQLERAEQYIQEQENLILQLRSRIQQFQCQQVQPDEYMYQIDARYKQIQEKLMQLSAQTTRSIESDSQLWNSWQHKRRQQIQNVQILISQSLSAFSSIEQTVIIHKDHLHRLDLTNLQEILVQLNKIKEEKGEITAAIRQNMEERLFEVLKNLPHESRL